MEVLSKREQLYSCEGDSSHIVKKSLEQVIHLSDDPKVQKINNYLESYMAGKNARKSLFNPYG